MAIYQYIDLIKQQLRAQKHLRYFFKHTKRNYNGLWLKFLCIDWLFFSKHFFITPWIPLIGNHFWQPTIKTIASKNKSTCCCFIRWVHWIQFIFCSQGLYWQQRRRQQQQQPHWSLILFYGLFDFEKCIRPSCDSLKW